MMKPEIYLLPLTPSSIPLGEGFGMKVRIAAEDNHSSLFETELFGEIIPYR